MKYYTRMFREAFNYSGRDSRKDYWMFFLIHILVSFGLGVIVGLFKLPPVLINVYAVIILFPAISAACRRAHDSNKSGWWMLMPFYNFYLLVARGEEVPNRFGEVPASKLKAVPTKAA